MQRRICASDRSSTALFELKYVTATPGSCSMTASERRQFAPLIGYPGIPALGVVDYNISSRLFLHATCHVWRLCSSKPSCTTARTSNLTRSMPRKVYLNNITTFNDLFTPSIHAKGIGHADQAQDLGRIPNQTYISEQFV